MKRNTLTLIALFAIILMMGACNSTAWDELPSPIASFVDEYFQFGEVESYTDTTNGSVVQIKKGATLTFNKDYDWIDVNGNGIPLPQNFLYDKLPPVLYDYIESIEHVGDVYRVSRTTDLITVKFHDSEITYDVDTQTITYPAA